MARNFGQRNTGFSAADFELEGAADDILDTEQSARPKNIHKIAENVASGIRLHKYLRCRCFIQIGKFGCDLVHLIGP
jgi:hypothetical protein